MHGPRMYVGGDASGHVIYLCRCPLLLSRSQTASYACVSVANLPGRNSASKFASTIFLTRLLSNKPKSVIIGGVQWTPRSLFTGRARTLSVAVTRGPPNAAPATVEQEVCQMLHVPQNIIKLAVRPMVLAMKIKVSNFTKYGAYCARNQRHCNGEGRPKNMHTPCQNFIPACSIRLFPRPSHHLLGPQKLVFFGFSMVYPHSIYIYYM